MYCLNRIFKNFWFIKKKYIEMCVCFICVNSGIDFFNFFFRLFEIIILLIIFVNCVVLVIYIFFSEDDFNVINFNLVSFKFRFGVVYCLLDNWMKDIDLACEVGETWDVCLIGVKVWRSLDFSGYFVFYLNWYLF